jgi:mRNA interferase MazF
MLIHDNLERMVFMLKETNKSFKRGNVVMVDYGKRDGSEQSSIRPSVIISNDKNNLYSPTIVVLPLTSSKFKKKLPTHVELNKSNSNVKMDSIVMAEQIRTIDKQYITNSEPLFTLSDEMMNKLDIAVAIQLGIVSLYQNARVTA